jgi:excinuclease ABC subunit A
MPWSLKKLAAQGFVRARIDGRIHELDALPKLDPKKKHTDRGGD